MISLEKLQLYLDRLLPTKGFSDYTPNGLQVEGKSSVQKIATAVSASLETIEEAVKLKTDALIVHHGIFWNRDSYLIHGTKRKKLQLLLENGLSLFAYHLPLDMHREIGNNWKAATDLGWSDLQPFGYLEGVPIGVKGKVNSRSRKKFQQELESYYGHPATCACRGPEVIHNVGLISGGAYKHILEASEDKLDAFITGNFDEPVWHQAKEENINFYALGHSATERVGPLALASHLKNVFSLPCEFIEVTNPF